LRRFFRFLFRGEGRVRADSDSGLFYPPLWVAFKKRNAEKEGADQGRGEIELEDHEIGLLGRTSVDTLDGLVEEDEEVGRARVKL
jgi:hypothetical protein